LFGIHIVVAVLCFENLSIFSVFHFHFRGSNFFGPRISTFLVHTSLTCRSSITLGLYQEWIELDLFHNGLATFTKADFDAAGITPEDQEFIRFMADQEQGHATLLTNMLGETAPPQWYVI